ncbi:MAG: PAAR domain-containing protein, partial [Fibrobacteria bacterium]
MGKPATRLTDMTAHGGLIVGPGVPTVMTGKMPAATILDQHVCPMVTGVVPHVGGPATFGSTGVFIGKKPAGRVGDLHVCVGPPSMPVMGCFTVLIGEVGSAGAGASAGSAAAADAAGTKGPASVQPFPLEEPPAATETHYSHFKFTDSAGKGLGGIPFTYTGPDKKEKRGSSAPGGEAYYSGLPKAGSYQVKAGALSDAKWSKAKAALGDSLDMTAKADGLKDGVEAIVTVLERSSNGQQRFLDHVRCKVSGKKIEAKWVADLGSDDAEALADASKRESFTYQFIAYAAGGVAVSDKLELSSDLEIEVLDEIEQPLADKPVEVLLMNGEVKTGKLDAKGKFKVGKVPAKPASVRLKVPGVFRGSLSGFTFDAGKSFIQPGTIANLKQVKDFYFNHPDLHILIVGHTDRVGKAEANLILSQDRADSISAFLRDDVKAWETWYGDAKPERSRWGILEDKIMLAELQDGNTHFLATPPDG